MTSIIKVTPLSGVHDEKPPCYMLQVDEFRFLLDCGWTEDFSMDAIDNIKSHIHQIDAVLLSHPDHLHLGALPYLVGQCGLECSIYATIPVYKMGQMFMYDLFQSRHNSEEFSIFTLDDVDAAFDKIIQVKYSQSLNLKGKGHGLTITALPAGHMVGGTIWKIVKDEEEIVYAIDYNHKKERHLNGCVLESISRPSLLITDAINAQYVQAKRRLRDEQLMNIILNTMRKDGNVLIAVDTAGRVVELSLLLDQLWRNQDSGLHAYNLALLNNVSFNVVEFAKSQVEWMSDKVMKAFEDKRNNPFHFKHLKLCHSLKELSKVPEPKTVLASVPDLECGYSRQLFIQWCHNPKNSVVLTSRTSPGTLARTLIDQEDYKSFKLRVSKRVKLEGKELDEYRVTEKEKEKERKAAEAKRRLESESSESSEDEMEVDEAGRLKPQHDIMVGAELNKKGTNFFKHARKTYAMYPFHEKRIQWDEYGEIINPEDFKMVETNIAEEDAGKQEEQADDADDIGEEEVDVPTKCTASEVAIDLKCSLTYIDFEGRSDGESIKKLVLQVKPRQLVIVRGSPAATQTLAEYYRLQLSGSKVFTPGVNEVIDATLESHIYQVKLKDSLVSSLDFQKAKDIELTWIDGQLDLETGGRSLMLEEEEETEMETTAPGLEMKKKKADDRIATLDAVSVSEETGHSQVFVNAPRFQDVKQVMTRNGILAEFTGGVLVCNSTVAVRRHESGRLCLEGTLCDDYFKVRDLLYEQYAVI
ncbi:cleavage and polyadenylation specificity factor subunit 2-like isoform X1 [Apostichopus japonicus]|uniref:cleavage and polyadenylation specificity factor subunit 2-like isoform X1 n=2 Tax=Stichopus japonicus TaxID=307972 RepID=UPI003AB89441